jgi:hypothetical protein
MFLKNAFIKVSLKQWSSNFFARGTLQSPKFFWRHTQICQNGKIDTENLYNMKVFEEFSVRFD